MFNKNDFSSTINGLFCSKVNAGDSIVRISQSIRTTKGYIHYCHMMPVLYLYRKPSCNTPREWLLMTRHVVDINLAYTKRKEKSIQMLSIIFMIIARI